MVTLTKIERWDKVYAAKASHPAWSCAEIAKYTNIPKTSVFRLLKEDRPIEELTLTPVGLHPGRPKIFSVAQQATLVGMVVFMVTAGVGMESEDIWQMSKDFYRKANGGEPETWFTKRTITRMLSQHNFTKRTENCLSFKRSQAHRPDIIEEYDTLTRATLLKNRCAEMIDGKFVITQPQCVWNADETALRGKRTKKRRVWVVRGQKEVFNVDNDSDSKEMITGLFFINLAGECQAPFVVFDTKHTNSNHLIPNCDIHVCSNNSGWMTGETLLSYFKETMLDKLKSNAPEGVTPTLLWDSHSSHLSYELLSLCKENGVCCQAIPPNGSVLFQPLDNKFNNNFQNRIANVRAPTEYNFKQSILFKVQKVLTHKLETEVLVKGAWAACGFVQLPNSKNFTFDKEILLARLPQSISRVPICDRISIEKTRLLASEIIDDVIKDNDHKRKRAPCSQQDDSVDNPRKRVGECGVVSTSAEFLEKLRITEEATKTKKAVAIAKRAEKEAKKAEKEKEKEIEKDVIEARRALKAANPKKVIPKSKSIHSFFQKKK